MVVTLPLNTSGRGVGMGSDKNPERASEVGMSAKRFFTPYRQRPRTPVVDLTVSKCWEQLDPGSQLGSSC